jgi:L-lactate dehydrogenase complex protein LldF
MTFRKRIRQSIENEDLQIALDNNKERRLKGRALAFQSIPDSEERRHRAHAIRADVIDHLDEYLAKFVAKSEENGVIIHCAKDAAEALDAVFESCFGKRGNQNRRNGSWRIHSAVAA